MIKNILILIIILMSVLTGQNNSKHIITSRVVDKKGIGIQGANVYIKNTFEGTISDETGNFTLQTQASGEILLVINHIKYTDKIILVTLNSDTEVTLPTIILQETTLSSKDVIVTASAFTMADEDGQTLKKMDVLTTAGASADIVRTLHTFPGVNQIDEGAGMYVRGGDASETVVLLDNATLQHPYKYESATGGYFGTINPFLLSGTFFATGGFSTKYGNALSGVLAMESLGMPKEKSLDFGLGLAAVSLGASFPIISNTLGLNFSGNYTNSELLFRVNSSDSYSYNDYPESWDRNLNINYKYSNKGNVKLFSYQSHDKIGIKYDYPSSTENITNTTDNSFTNLNIKHLFFSKYISNTSISRNKFKRKYLLENFNFTNEDRISSLRFNLRFPILNKIDLNSGFDINDYFTSISGDILETVDSKKNIISNFAFRVTNQTTSFHVEPEINLLPNLLFISGYRLDHNITTKRSTVDPRSSIAYSFKQYHTLRLASGIFHQFPEALYLNSEFGNKELSSSKAIHYIAGYEYASPLINTKLEIYRKNYTELILIDTDTNYSNNGYGHAHGIDVFLKGDLLYYSGWLSYSYLVAKRVENEFTDLVPTNYDIRHKLSCVIKRYLNTKNLLSITYKYASGRPHTPLQSKWNSARLPSINSLDLSISHISSVSHGQLVLYCGVSNVFNNKNTYGYSNSLDNSESIEIKSVFGRSIYFGIAFNIK